MCWSNSCYFTANSYAQTDSRFHPPAIGTNLPSCVCKPQNIKQIKLTGMSSVCPTTIIYGGLLIVESCAKYSS